MFDVFDKLVQEAIAKAPTEKSDDHFSIEVAIARDDLGEAIAAIRALTEGRQVKLRALSVAVKVGQEAAAVLRATLKPNV